ncbi:uncharacterized protein BKA78DRAFT_170426 [Phyllosticta capitalensis]|uniref:uncharacterized protein n=1 Tax=Phyllosticta capitalensis TaxID=121624 RepID=UPI0031304B0F
MSAFAADEPPHEPPFFSPPQISQKHLGLKQNAARCAQPSKGATIVITSYNGIHAATHRFAHVFLLAATPSHKTTHHPRGPSTALPTPAAQPNICDALHPPLLHILVSHNTHPHHPHRDEALTTMHQASSLRDGTNSHDRPPRR